MLLSDGKAPGVRRIDIATYGRRSVFDFFINFDVPVHSRTVEIDISKALKHIKQEKLLFSLSMTLLITRAGNAVAEFRHRIQNGAPVEYDFVVPAYTHLNGKDTLRIVRGSFSGDFSKDYAENLATRNEVTAGDVQPFNLTDKGYIFVSVNPWFSFTSLTLPYSRHTSSIPTISIGRYAERDGKVLLPIAIQTHHSLVDGYHVGQFLEALSTYLDDPQRHMAADRG